MVPLCTDSLKDQFSFSPEVKTDWRSTRNCTVKL